MALVALAGVCTAMYLFSRLYLKKKQQESRTREETQHGPVFNNRNQLTGPPAAVKSSVFVGQGQYGIPKWKVTFEDGKVTYKYSHTNPATLLAT